MAVDVADAAVHRIQYHFVFLREQTQGTAGLLRPEQSTDPLEQHRHLRDRRVGQNHASRQETGKIRQGQVTRTQNGPNMVKKSCGNLQKAE